MNLMQKGINQRIIYIDEQKNTVTYLFAQKIRKLSNPEETVQLKTYLELIFLYRYSPTQISVCQSLKIGSSSREADIIVYTDSSKKTPLIIVECKSKNSSESVMQQAIEQGFSYAISQNATYIWITNGTIHYHYKVWLHKPNERNKNLIYQIPSANKENTTGFRLKNSLYSIFKRFTKRNLSSKLTKGSVKALKLTLLFSTIGVVSQTLLSFVLVSFHDALVSLLKNSNVIFLLLFMLSGLLSVFFAGSIGISLLHDVIRKSLLKWLLRFKWLLFALAYLPILYAGFNQVSGWWQMDNFHRLDYKLILYLMPYLEGLLSQIGLLFLVVWSRVFLRK